MNIASSGERLGRLRPHREVRNRERKEGGTPCDRPIDPPMGSIASRQELHPDCRSIALTFATEQEVPTSGCAALKSLFASGGSAPKSEPVKSRPARLKYKAFRNG